MTVTITQDLRDIGSVPDNVTVRFGSPVARQSGSSLITTKWKSFTAVNGILTAVVEPGPAKVMIRHVGTFDITIPNTASDLWSLIQAAVALPPTTSADQLAQAIGDYLNAHPTGSADEYHEYANLAAFPGTGVADRIYVAVDTGLLYRWTGSTYTQIGGSGSGGTAVEVATHAASSKTTPVDADELPLVDSAASNGLKKLTVANLKAWVKSWIAKADVGLSAVDNTADASKPVSTAQQTALDGKQSALTTTAVKTGNYTAVANEIVPVDASAGPVTITLTATPTDKDRNFVKKIDASTNAVTVTCGGSDVFNKAGGPTSATLKLQNQALQLQYKASTAIWYVISTDVPLSGTDARYSDASPVGNGPLNGVISHLKRTRSAVIQIVGDSTAVGGIGGSVSWPYRICDKIAAYYDANLWTCLWNPTNQSYDPPSARSVSTQGERQLSIPANHRVNYVGVPVTGDMEIIMKITPAAWTGNVQNLLTKWTTTGNQRGFQFRLSTTGQLTLLWTTDGTTGTQVTANSTATVGFTAGAAGWVRATLDVDNGSSGYTVTFYTSTTGLTWTQLGTAVTAAGVTSVFPSTQPYEIYGGIGGAINHTWVQVRNALANGVDVVPQLPDKWGNSLTFQPTVTGGPMLLLMNGGESGKDVAWFDDPTRRPKVLATHLPDVIFTALGINDADQMWRSWADKYVTFVRHLQSWRPNVPVVVTTQNPVGLGGSYTFSFQVQGVAERHATLARALQAEPGVTVLDTAQAYTDLTTQVNATDKVHPTDAGYIAQTDWMMRRLAPQTIN